MNIANVLPFFRRQFAAPQPKQDAGAAGLRSASPVALPYGPLQSAGDPDLTLRAIGWRRAELQRLETDDEVFGALNTRLEAVLSTSWRLEPSVGDFPEFVCEELKRVINPFLAGAWTALGYGFSVVDVIYRDAGNGRIGLAAARKMPVGLFSINADEQLLYFRPGVGGAELADTEFKLFLTRSQASAANPFGEALLSRLYWPWYFRHNLWRFRMEYLERFIDPILTGKVFSPKDFVEAMQKLGFKSVAAVGKDEEVKAELASAAGENDSAARALDARIQKAVLGQTLTTDVGSTGSFAAASVHNLVRIDKRNADLRMLNGTVLALINALCVLNNQPANSIEFAWEDDIGIGTDRATRDTSLMNTGRVKLSKEYFLRAYDYDEGELEVVEPPAAAPVGAQAAKGGAQAQQNAAVVGLGASRAPIALGRRAFTSRQRQVEAVGGAAIGLADQPIDPDVLRTAIMAAADEADLAERLAVALGADLDQYQFAAALEDALFAARVLGYVHAETNQPAE